MRLKKLIFDTSGLNALADDCEEEIIVRGLRSAYFVGITESAISEVAANSSPTRRRKLLALMGRLLKAGMCILPYNVIAERHAEAYREHRERYLWTEVDVRFPEAELEIVDQEIIHAISDQARKTLHEWDKGFRKVFADARHAFEVLFDSPARPTLGEVTERLLDEGGAHLALAADLFEKWTGERLSEAETKNFMDKCPPFKALLVAICFSQYDRCIRPSKQPSLGRAGRIDMFSAAYLPYCGVFVTQDAGQYNALFRVAELMGLETTSVLTYTTFRDRLFALGT